MRYINYLKLYTNRFCNDVKGQISIIFAVMMLPMTLSIGAAFDYAMVLQHEQKLQSTMDSVALAVAKEISINKNVSEAHLDEIANHIHTQNMHGLDADLYDLASFNFVRTDYDITVSQTGMVKNNFLSLIGYDEMQISSRSKVILESKNVEMALMLDMSGSMNWSGKLNNLKASSEKLVDILIKEQKGITSFKIGFVPWSIGVNISNLNPKHMMKNNSQGHYQCATSRYGDLSDESPLNNATNIAFYKGDVNGYYNHCPTATITPLSDDKQLLKNEIASWTATSGTSSNAGLFWGWGVLSPNWSDVWPNDRAGETYEESRKFALLMTDGENNASLLDGYSEDLCNEMKRKGITIYAVAFQAPEQAKEMLRRCASGTTTYIDAANGGELSKAFEQVAREVATIYIGE